MTRPVVVKEGGLCRRLGPTIPATVFTITASGEAYEAYMRIHAHISVVEDAIILVPYRYMSFSEP